MFRHTITLLALALGGCNQGTKNCITWADLDAQLSERYEAVYQEGYDRAALVFEARLSALESSQKANYDRFAALEVSQQRERMLPAAMDLSSPNWAVVGRSVLGDSQEGREGSTLIRCYNNDARDYAEIATTKSTARRDPFVGLIGHTSVGDFSSIIGGSGSLNDP